MAALSTAERNALPDRDFALPGRRYPIDTPGRARNALSRAHFANREEQREICSKVHQRYPEIHESHCGMHARQSTPAGIAAAERGR